MSLDPAWLARLAPLELRARARSEGLWAGRHAGRRPGPAGDFLGRRPYTPGDEWRRVDWKVYARTDRWTVRETQDETHLQATLLLDVSRSMSFAADGRAPKVHHAAKLLSALAYLLLRRQDPCGLALLNDRLVDRVPPRGGAEQLNRLFSRLENVTAEGPTDLGRGLGELLPLLPRRGVVVLASDFLQPVDGWWPALRSLRVRGMDVIAFQILDPVEISLGLRGTRRFVDLETGDALTVDPPTVAGRYRARMADRQAVLARSFAASAVDYALFETDKSLDVALARFLRSRLNRS